MTKLNLTKFRSKEMDEVFRDTLDCFRAYHPSFCGNPVEQNENNLLEVIKSSLIQAAEGLLEEDHRSESIDVDVELKTIFEILNGEKPSGISCVKFNLRFIYFLTKKLKDDATFNFPTANFIFVNAIKYREAHRDIY